MMCWLLQFAGCRYLLLLVLLAAAAVAVGGCRCADELLGPPTCAKSRVAQHCPASPCLHPLGALPISCRRLLSRPIWQKIKWRLPHSKPTPAGVAPGGGPAPAGAGSSPVGCLLRGWHIPQPPFPSHPAHGVPCSHACLWLSFFSLRHCLGAHHSQPPTCCRHPASPPPIGGALPTRPASPARSTTLPCLPASCQAARTASTRR